MFSNRYSGSILRISLLISSGKPGREKGHDLTKMLVTQLESSVDCNISVGGLLPRRSAIEGEFPSHEQKIEKLQISSG